MKNIREYSLVELTELLKGRGEEPYRARQIFDWLYHQGAQTADEMKNIPASLREALREEFAFSFPAVKGRKAAADGTVKLLLGLDDGEQIETVLIPAQKRRTVCVSSQAGCKYSCRFCASTLNGLKRNLTAGEIVSQVILAQKEAAPLPVSHVVVMGIGEPLDNYTEVLKALRLINAPEGLNIAARRITLSTCGLIPQIRRLARERMQFELSVSLHAYDEHSRGAIMPVNQKYPLTELLGACRDYVRDTGRQITFEYIMLKDFNCHREAARALAKLLKGLLCKINLILYNPIPGGVYQPPTRAQARVFQKMLTDAGLVATLRSPRGGDVQAACGQLRAGQRPS